MPYLICNSVVEVCEQCGIELEYYHINSNWLPKINTILKDNDWIYIVNYYGQLSNEKIKELKKKYTNIIIDNVQAFYQRPVVGVDTIYSCRKFFGVPDGAYLYTNVFYEGEIEQDYSSARMAHLLEKYENSTNLSYEKYNRIEQSLSHENIKKMSKLTKNLMRGIQYENIAKRRSENFKYVNQKLREVNRLHPKEVYGAFMYPLYISNGAEIRKKLREKKIYIPCFWEDVLERCTKDDLEYDVSMNILPLPIDQRYSNIDMEFLIQKLIVCV